MYSYEMGFVCVVYTEEISHNCARLTRLSYALLNYPNEAIQTIVLWVVINVRKYD